MDIEEALQRLGVGVGVAALGIGMVLLFTPDVALSIPVNLLFADIAALIAILLAGFAVRKRYRTQPNQTPVPDAELPISTPTPGHDLDRLIYRVSELQEGTIEYREQIRERITEIGIAVIMQREDCSREEALEILRDGTWTDNGSAASFFTGESPSSTLIEEMQQRLLGEESGYEQQLRATVSAIEDQATALIGEDTRESYDVESDTDESEMDQGMDPGGVILADEGEQITETHRYRSLIRTHHWSGIAAFALAAIAVGTISTQPAVLLASAAGLAMATYSRVLPPPELATLEVTRDLSEESPEPGDEVDVTVTVENTGDSFLSDLRLVDRVPPTMRVIDGSARLGIALRPGQTATFKYTLVAEHGEHSWPLQAIGRDPSGAIEREALIEPEATMDCVPRLKTTSEAALRRQTSAYAGQLNTERGGDGIEFFSVRDYLPGDPMRRIDWNTYARTGEFATIDYRQERSAKVMLMFDTRKSAYVSSGQGRKHAVDRAKEAAFDIFPSLYDQGHLIGITAYDTVPCYLGASRGSTHVERVRQLFMNHPALSSLPPDVLEKEGRYIDPMVQIRRQLPQSTQIFLFSPLTDSFTYEAIRQLNGAGHRVTVISPDPTAIRTIGQRVARLERQMWINLLREHNIPVIDWKEGRSLRLELQRSQQR